MSDSAAAAETDAATPAEPLPAPAPAVPTAESRWAGWVAIGVMGLTPLLAYLWSLGFAAVVALAGLLCLPLLRRSRRPDLGQALLLALTVWALVSMAWTTAVPERHGIEGVTGVKLALELGLYGAFVAGALTLGRAAGARASLVLAVGLLAITAVFLADGLTKAQLYQWIRAAVGQPQRPDWAMRDVARASYVLALLFWPAYLRLEQARWPIPSAVMAGAMLVGCYLLNADAPLAALVVSGVVFAAVRFLGRPALLAWIGAVALYFLAAPILIHALGHGALIHPAADDIRVQSWAIRTDIWRFAADRIFEKPFWGWGLDAARTFSPDIPLHTHNAAIQVWLELGAVGAGLAALFWLWLGGRIDAIEARDRPLAAACAACASGYLTIGALSFGVWQEWWLALGALSVVACAALAAARRDLIVRHPRAKAEGRRPEDPAAPDPTEQNPASEPQPAGSSGLRSATPEDDG
jgi:O-antigen ligase